MAADDDGDRLRSARRPVVVVMGISGSGKTTIGMALARRLGCAFQEGDAFHPPENVEKMRSGIPLTDADRAPWLDKVAAWIAARAAADEAGVIACSALKRTYRDRLRAADPELAFVFLDPGEAVLRERLARRTGHFMPASLLASQLETLEPPALSERSIRLSGEEDIEAACDRITAWLNATATCAS
jgi:gluconokinase